MYYVYKIMDQSDQVLYVGESTNPNNRLYEHTRKKPTVSGRGKFYKQNVKMQIVSVHYSKKAAWWAQVNLQKHYGLETDYDKLRNGVSFESCSKGGRMTHRNRKNDRVAVK